MLSIEKQTPEYNSQIPIRRYPLYFFVKSPFHFISACLSAMDIFFLLDSSDSVGSDNFATALKFINVLIGEFSGEESYNRFSLITFSTDVQIVFSLGRYRDIRIIQNAVKYARYRPGNTNTANALKVVEEIAVDALGDRHDAQNVVFVITDGNSNVNEDETIPAVEVLKKNGARIIPIAVNMQDYSEVEQLATNAADIYKIDSFDDLNGILENVIQNTCSAEEN